MNWDILFNSHRQTAYECGILNVGYWVNVTKYFAQIQIDQVGFDRIGQTFQRVVD
jgi:hypothetical protein